VLKTYKFFPAKDLSLIRDFFKTILDENNAKAEDFQREIDQINKVGEESRNDKSIDFRQKVKEITKGNDVIIHAYVYQEAIKECRKYPKGVWVAKISAKKNLQFLQQAKEYFARKKKFNS
jgi:hypothetical protein